MDRRIGQNDHEQVSPSRRMQMRRGKPSRRERSPAVEALEERALLTSLFNQFPVPTPSTSPVSIAKGADGNLWYAERDSGTIGQITPAGAVLTFTIPTTASAPTSITAGPSGTTGMWFTESATNKIGELDTLTQNFTEYAIPTASSQPTGIAAGPDGNLWFTEKAANKIGQITPSGTVTEYTIPTANSQPTAITAGPNGNLWFTETGANKIGEINPATGTITEFSTGLTASSGLAGITTGPDNNLWFTESSGNKIGQITPAGVITEFSTGLTPNSAPTGITSGPNGNLWFTENAANKVAEITTSGAITEFVLTTANSAPTGITAGPDGNIWLTEQAGDKIAQVTPSGSATEFIAQTPSTEPFGITLGPTSDGALWFTEQSLGTSSIGRITSTGSFHLYNLPSTTYPQYIATGPDGALWFTDSVDNRIGRITTTGSVVTYNVTGVPQGITNGPTGNGNLWFTLQSSTNGVPDAIGKISPTGTITTYNLPTTDGAPSQIAVGPDGNLWFTESFGDKIGRINPTTNQFAEFNVPTANASPTGIVAGPDGNLWFTETAANKIGRITPTGNITEYSVPTASSSPSGITVGSDGNVWFTEAATGASKIANINPTTGAIREFPVPTSGSSPTNITKGPDGNIWFTEFNANQIGQLVLNNIGAPNTPQLSPQSDTGVSNSDGITKDNGTQSAPLTFTFSDVTPANGFVSLYNVTNSNSPALLAGPVQASNGVATVTIAGSQPLPDGTYKIAATTAATSNGTQSAMSAPTTITIQTSTHVTSTSPSNNSATSTLPNGQILVTFNHPLANLVPDQPKSAGFASDPFAVMLIPSGPDGGARLTNGSPSLWSAPSGVDSGDLPVPASMVYHVNADGTSQITLTPAFPLSSDIYLIAVQGESDVAGNAVTDANGNPGPIYSSFDYQASPSSTVPFRVLDVTANHGATVINNNLIPQPDTIAIQFNRPASTWTVNSNTIQLMANTGPGGQYQVVPSAVAYSPTTDSAYLTPEAILKTGTVYLVSVAGSVSDDQSFPSSTFTLGTPFYTTFTVSTDGGITGNSPLTVTGTVPNNGTQFLHPLGYGSVTFSEPISLSSLGRFSAMLIPQTGGLTTGASGYADVPLNAKLAFNLSTNQLIMVPTQPVANQVFLFSISNITAANGTDHLVTPGGAPYFATFQLLASGVGPLVVPTSNTGTVTPAGSIVTIPTDNSNSKHN